MKLQRVSFFTVIWLMLISLTVLTYGIGDAGMTGTVVMLILLAIALIKGQMVANYFMGLRHAGWLWRSIILVYFLVVGSLIAIAYLIGLK